MRFIDDVERRFALRGAWIEIFHGIDHAIHGVFHGGRMSDLRRRVLPGVVWGGFSEPSVRSLSEFPHNKGEQCQHTKEERVIDGAIHIAEGLLA